MKKNSIRFFIINVMHISMMKKFLKFTCDNQHHAHIDV